jgi:hypothetical protein
VLTAQVYLPGLTSSVPTARHFAESILTSWSHPDIAWTAALLVSELAANCALHARTEFTVRVVLTDQVVRIEVSDGSLRVPHQRSYGLDATTGRGLRLVAQLALHWGVTPMEGGKTVWLELGLVSAPDGRADTDLVEADDLLAAYSDDGNASSGSSVRAGLPAAA